MKTLLLTALLTTTAWHAQAADHSHHNHADHAAHHHDAAEPYYPKHVMGTHTHNPDEWMFSYRYMRMEMKGLQAGNDKISNQQAYNAGYMVAPLKMTSDMHMFGAMKGLTSDFTLMAMASYIKKDMTLRNQAGVTFATSSEGMGDTKISLIDNLTRYGFNKWTTMVTLSLPTGKTDQEANTPMGANTRLPYPMQLGSGTYDITPAVTYQCNCKGFDYGAQAYATFRINDNEEDYRLGNQFGFKAWVGKNFTDSLAAGATFNWTTQNNLSGEDDNLNPNMVVTADKRNTGYDLASLTLDVAYKPAVLNGLELVSSYEEPIYQDVNGIQMHRQRTFSLGLRKTF
ncbi:MAG: hypothetical protein CMF60_05630 [Magnetococcales bacterium]|nr:hypothetical protein [Magnetococcales bacterium]|tara:strand:+ start:18434 stop:19459 length:1026 start_codon:yes stop_codon:yes gene_type:complete